MIILVLPIVKIDQLEEKNRLLHNTIKFTTNQFVVRRGQTIFMDIHLARSFIKESDNFYITLNTGKKPREYDKSFIHMKRVEEFDALNEVWAYKIIGTNKNIIHIEVNCPSDALIAKYEMTIEDDDDLIFTHNQPLVVLFNPWNKGKLLHYFITLYGQCFILAKKLPNGDMCNDQLPNLYKFLIV